MMSDLRTRLDGLGDLGTTDPFESIYDTILQLTCRTIACHELADSEEKLVALSKGLQKVAFGAAPAGVVFPRLPSPSQIKRLLAGARLYRMLSPIIRARLDGETRHDDPLQYLVDQGDDLYSIFIFIVANSGAGILNTGIDAAWILCHLATNAEWLGRVKKEVEAAAEKYGGPDDTTVEAKLARVPLEGWDSSFPNIELCLRECIRLTAIGNLPRFNAGPDIPIGDYVVPSRTWVVRSLIALCRIS